MTLLRLDDDGHARRRGRQGSPQPEPKSPRPRALVSQGARGSWPPRRPPSIDDQLRELLDRRGDRSPGGWVSVE
jgi:hypothetical protein